MTREDIIRMAQNEYGIYAFTAESLADFATLVTAKAHADCAQLLEAMAARTDDIRRAALEMAAENIRAKAAQ